MSDQELGHPPRPARDAISEVTTQRLSLYLRCLKQLEEEGRKTVSSQEMADLVQLNSAQIRKDLAYFGELGIRGVGYDVSALKNHLIRTLGIDTTRNVLIVGAGNLGQALANYPGFQQDGFEIVAMLDTDPQKIGESVREGLTIQSIEEIESIVDDHDVEIGVLAVPADAAQAVYDRMVDAGIRSIMNFAPTHIREHADVKLKTVDLRVCLECLSFHLARE